MYTFNESCWYPSCLGRLRIPITARPSCSRMTLCMLHLKPLGERCWEPRCALRCHGELCGLHCRSAEPRRGYYLAHLPVLHQWQFRARGRCPGSCMARGQRMQLQDPRSVRAGGPGLPLPARSPPPLRQRLGRGWRLRWRHSMGSTQLSAACAPARCCRAVSPHSQHPLLRIAHRTRGGWRRRSAAGWGGAAVTAHNPRSKHS